MDTEKLLGETFKKVLFDVVNMELEELNSFIEYGHNIYSTYRDVVLPDAYLNKHLEPFAQMPPEKQQALLYALITLHGMCETEIRLQEKTD